MCVCRLKNTKLKSVPRNKTLGKQQLNLSLPQTGSFPPYEFRRDPKGSGLSGGDGFIQSLTRFRRFPRITSSHRLRWRRCGSGRFRSAWIPWLGPLLRVHGFAFAPTFTLSFSFFLSHWFRFDCGVLRLNWLGQFCCSVFASSSSAFPFSCSACVPYVRLFYPGDSARPSRIHRVPRIQRVASDVLSISTVARTGSVVVQTPAGRRQIGWGRRRRSSPGTADRPPGTGTRPCSPGKSPAAGTG